jgi:hypothetical protein
VTLGYSWPPLGAPASSPAHSTVMHNCLHETLPTIHLLIHKFLVFHATSRRDAGVPRRAWSSSSYRFFNPARLVAGLPCDLGIFMAPLGAPASSPAHSTVMHNCLHETLPTIHLLIHKFLVFHATSRRDAGVPRGA